MRTTVTLTPEAESLVRRLMQERGLSFKDAINSAILNDADARVFDETKRTTRTSSMGKPRVSIEKALQLAGDLEDEALVEKMKLGK